MAMLFVTLMVMLLVVVGMSVGVLFGRKPLSGSCGGVGAALGQKDYVCDLCGNDESKCKEINERQEAGESFEGLAYDATRHGTAGQDSGERGEKTTHSTTEKGGHS